MRVLSALPPEHILHVQCTTRAVPGTIKTCEEATVIVGDASGRVEEWQSEGMSVTEIELYFDEKSLGKANASVQGGQRGPSYFRRSGLSKAFR